MHQALTGERQRADLMGSQRELAGAHPGISDSILPLVRCPIDGEALTWDRAAGELRDTNHRYPIRNGIPFLFAPRVAPGVPENDVTDVVKGFYEDTPFPNYDGLDTRDSLRKRRARA